MKVRKLSDRKRHYYAWQFLRRHPDYIFLYDEYVDAKKQWNITKNHLSKTKRNHVLRRVTEEKRNFMIRFDLGFGMRCPPLNPNQIEFSPGVLSDYFSKVKPVFETILPPTGEDDTINLSIRLSYGMERINQESMNIVRLARQRKNIKSSNYQSSEDELRLYLYIIDHYKVFARDGSLSKSIEANYGLNLRWTEFSRDLNLQGFGVDPNTLRRTTFKTSLSMMLQAPFSILQ